MNGFATDEKDGQTSVGRLKTALQRPGKAFPRRQFPVSAAMTD